MRTLFHEVQGELELRCPTCHFDHVRLPKEAIFVSGNDNWEADSRVRGDVIGLPFMCESGHPFVIWFGNHKGHVIFWCDTYNVKE